MSGAVGDDAIKVAWPRELVQKDWQLMLLLPWQCVVHDLLFPP